MMSLPAILVGVFGLLIGSFLNVVIYRVPAGRSIVSPGSSCGGCGSPIRSWDNIPVLSWLLLRGRCRDCWVNISVRYPLVELGTALSFGVVAWWVLNTGLAVGVLSAGLIAGIVLTLVAFLYLAALSVSLALIDLDTHTLPNRIVLPAYPVGAVLLTAAAVLTGNPGRILTALVGCGALFGLYLAMTLAYPAGMGFGDIKLAGVLGLFLGWLGWAPLVVGAFSAFLLGGVFALALVVTRRAKRKSGIPFGPWMLAGTWLGIFFGGQIATSYLSLFNLA